MSLTFDEASAVSIRVREHAAELGATVTIAIVDAGGHLKVLDRMDGASPMSARVAPAKASAVALFHQDSSDLLRLQQAYPAVFAQIIDVAGAPIVAGGAARRDTRTGRGLRRRRARLRVALRIGDVGTLCLVQRDGRAFQRSVRKLLVGWRCVGGLLSDQGFMLVVRPLIRL